MAMETTKLAFGFHDISPGQLSVTTATSLGHESLEELLQSLSLEIFPSSHCYVFGFSSNAAYADFFGFLITERRLIICLFNSWFNFNTQSEDLRLIKMKHCVS